MVFQILNQQIGRLERGLTKWNEDEFGNVIFKKNQLTIEHNELDSMEEIRHRSDEEMQKQVQMRVELEKIYSYVGD